MVFLLYGDLPWTKKNDTIADTMKEKVKNQTRYIKAICDLLPQPLQLNYKMSLASDPQTKPDYELLRAALLKLKRSLANPSSDTRY